MVLVKDAHAATSGARRSHKFTSRKEDWQDLEELEGGKRPRLSQLALHASSHIGQPGPA